MLSITILLRWSIIAFLLIASWQIVSPFVGTFLLAAVLVVSTWPLHDFVARKIKGRALRASILIFGWLIVLAGPLMGIAYMVSENANHWVATIYDFIQTHQLQTQLPAFIKNLPWVGSSLQDYWFKLTHNRDELSRLLQLMISPAKDMGIEGVQRLFQSVAQLLGVLVIAWFLYYEGIRLAQWVEKIAVRIESKLGSALLHRAMVTVRAVMLGLVGSALGQALVMALGLWMANVPQIGLLSAATFFLSLIPGGPALVWGGAAFWLYGEGHTGWSLFLVLWGLLAVSSVDNILKPMLMSKGADQSLLLITLGVFGGAFAFGFIGLFLGPVILGVVATLLDVWLERPDHTNDDVA